MGENIENEEMSNILKENEDYNLTMFRIIRAICNHVNNKMENGGESSKILGKGYKEDNEEDNQVMQMPLSMNGGKSRRFIDTPYPSEENMHHEKLTETNGLYPGLSEMQAKEQDRSRSTLRMDEIDISKRETSFKYADDYDKGAIRKNLMTNEQAKRQHNKGELSMSTSGYIEDIEKIVDITIKSMRRCREG